MATDPNPTKSFDDFLLAEYDHVANAHFESGKQVSSFFNYYLVILAAPAIIISLIHDTELFKYIQPANESENVIHYIAITLLGIIAIFGYCLSWYVIGLIHDSLLYTRAINGVRNYFYEHNGLPEEENKKIKVLHVDKNKPSFFSFTHLGIIVIAFANVNTVFLLACTFIVSYGQIKYWHVLLGLAFFLLHILTYYLLSRQRENWYKDKTDDHDSIPVNFVK